jgi:hypothetical protein
VRRLLFVFRGPVRAEDLRRCRDALADASCEVAVCVVLPAGQSGVKDAIREQRATTAALRHVFGADAEAVAVFAATDEEGDRPSDCARAWGATEVVG